MAKTKFKKEFKKQLRLAIAAAAGFLIIYGWRNAIFNNFQKFLANYNIQSDLLSALFMTVAGVLLIIVFSKILQE